jgi:hypothetical protein
VSRPLLSAAATALAGLALSACGGGGDPVPTGTTATGGGTPAASAEQVAAAVEAYRADLRAYARDLRRDAGRKPRQRALARAAGAPPQLEALSTDDDAYAEARADADAVDALSDELALVAGSDGEADGDLYNRLYGLAADQWSRDFKRSQRQFDQVSPLVTPGRIDAPGTDRRIEGIWTRYMRAEQASWKRYARRVDRVKAKGELPRSFLDYELMEIDEAMAFRDEFLDHLREQPAELTQLGFYTSQAAKFSPYQVPVTILWTRDKALARAFVRAIGRVARGDEASVGDPYRATILSAFMSPLEQYRYGEGRLTEQLWMLFRIRQLEETPEEAYRDARLTLLLQGIDDVRNPYTRLIEIYAAGDGDMLAGKQGPPRAFTAYLDWAHEQLSRPAPPILEPTVAAMDRGLERFPQKRSKVVFRTLDLLVKAQRKIERDMREGAERVDSPRQLRKATAEALAATRPR